MKQAGHDTKLVPAKHEMLCTLYTRDEDLKAVGEPIHAYASTVHSKGSLVRKSQNKHLWDSENINMRRSRVKDSKMLSKVYQELILHPNTYYESKAVQQWMLERSGPDPNEHRRAMSLDVEGIGGARKRGGRGYVWPVRRHTTGCGWPTMGSHMAGQHTTDKSMPGSGGVATGEMGHAMAGGVATGHTSAAMATGDAWLTKAGVTRREGMPGPGDGFQYYTLTKTAKLELKLDGLTSGEGTATEAEESFRARSEDSDEMSGETHGSLFEWSEVYPIVKTCDGLLVDKCRTGFQARAITPLPPIRGTGKGMDVSPAMGMRMGISPAMGTRMGVSPAMSMRGSPTIGSAVGTRGTPALAPISRQHKATTNTIHVKLPRMETRQASTVAI